MHLATKSQTKKIEQKLNKPKQQKPQQTQKKTQTSNPAMARKIQKEREKKNHREFLAVPVVATATTLELTWSHQWTYSVWVHDARNWFKADGWSGFVRVGFRVDGWSGFVRVRELKDGSCNRVFRFKLFRFSVCFLFGQDGAFSRCQLITSSPLQLCRFELIWQKKKKNISKMTWQLTAKSNWQCDLLTEPNVRVSNQSSETLGCKIQSPPNVRGVLCNLA